MGLSTITGPQLHPVIDTSKRLKALGVPVVWGGVHATIMPEDVLKEDYVDYVVINEGEEIVQELARMLAGQIPTDCRRPGLNAGLGLEGRRRRSNRLSRHNLERPLHPGPGPLPPALGPDPGRALPDPVWSLRPACAAGLHLARLPVPLRLLLQRSGDEAHLAAALATSSSWTQVQWLKDNFHINAVDYADDYLFGRIKPMQRLVEKVGMPWSGQVRVQLLKPEFVTWMKDTGCQWVNIGAEWARRPCSIRCIRTRSAEQIEWGVRNLVDIAPHIEANLSFIVGLPEENEVERKVTFDLIERLAAMSPKVRCSVCVYMPYPGTPLWPDALKRGYVPPDQPGGLDATWTSTAATRRGCPTPKPR